MFMMYMMCSLPFSISSSVTGASVPGTRERPPAVGAAADPGATRHPEFEIVGATPDRRAARDGDVVIAMGAGTIGGVPPRLVELLGGQP